MLKSLILIFVIFYPIFLSAQKSADTLLTKEEIAWLKNNKDSIVFIENASWPPGEFVENNEHKGIVSDYVKIFEQKLGVRFKRLRYYRWENVCNSALNKEGDIIGAIQETDERDAFLNFTDPFLYVPLVVLERNDFPYLITENNIYQ